MSLRDALANVLHDSGCGCSEGPDEYTYAEADAILASDVIAKVKADALREAAGAYKSGQLTGIFRGRDDYPREWLRARADKIERGEA